MRLSVSGPRTDQVRVQVLTVDNYLIMLEWQILDIALQTYCKVSVSLYDTLGADAVGKIFSSPIPNS